MRAARRGNTYYAESRSCKGAAYVSTEKDVWHRHANMRIFEEMEDEHMVVMKTTVGDIEAELWVKETPKTCRNFIQLCMEGYWDNNIFHTQGGDPTDTGEGCKIYGEPFKDDFRTRLRSYGRGLITGGHAGEDDNDFQFFFTPSSTLDLQI
ncbi:Peptidyl-prolyl cis-trans isomerase CWC27 like protein [Eufriesea mexicana]|uniref:Peptidyl-prolyl cis-trans isomerase n=1 Tax=Eufriesea mexicana TaxID=516756 RepID=A0A310S6U3_9HYME|nr:Peptidyl-prolyl cis-trans isomerase CWC27 like protein [Eufriesea mexicana]